MPIAKYKKDKKSGLYYTYEKTGLFFPNGKPKYKKIHGKTIETVDRKVKEFHAQIASGVINTEITVDDWFGQWFGAYKQNLRPNTLKTYRSSYHCHIKPRIGSLQLSQIKEVQLQKILNDIAEDHAVSTVQTARFVLFSLFEKAERNNLIVKSPAAHLTIAGAPKKDRRALTAEERKLYLARCLEDDFGTFAAFLYFFGLRRAEALALTADDIYSDHIEVNKQIHFSKNGVGSIAPPKTKASVRSIPIPTLARKYIDFDAFESGFLFADPLGNPLTDYRVRMNWTSFITAALGENTDITIHCVRHNYCTMLFENGVDVWNAQQCLGHKDTKTTMSIYTHLTEQLREKDLGKILSIG